LHLVIDVLVKHLNEIGNTHGHIAVMAMEKHCSLFVVNISTSLGATRRRVTTERTTEIIEIWTLTFELLEPRRNETNIFVVQPIHD
jgi:hypothetical protein